MFRKITITLFVLALICSLLVFSFGESKNGASENNNKAASVASKKATGNLKPLSAEHESA